MKRWMGAAFAAMMITGLGLAADTEFDGYKSKLPDGWKSEETSNKMRVFQAKLEKEKGDSEDADLIVFYFGKGSGGGIEENIKRWKDQFEAPEGKKIDDLSKKTEFKAADGKVNVTHLAINGATYKFKAQPFNPNSPVTEKKDFSMLGAIFESENGPYFIRVTGPAKTVEKHAKAFESWLKAFKK